MPDLRGSVSSVARNQRFRSSSSARGLAKSAFIRQAARLGFRPRSHRAPRSGAASRWSAASLAPDVGRGISVAPAPSSGTANTLNRHSTKTLTGDFGALPMDVPRDHQGTFEPQIVVKHQTRWAGFDDKIISFYVRCLCVREIQGHLEEIYGAEVPPLLTSNVTDAVSENVNLWQACPLDAMDPILYLDCINVRCATEAWCAPRRST